MSLFVFNGLELELDLNDAFDMEKCENAYEQMAATEKRLVKVGKASEIMIDYCKMIFDFFDNIFGEGTSQKMFGGKYNQRLVDEAYGGFLQFAKEQGEESRKYRLEVVNKYRPNRTQRRTKK